jgi:hypothetical protein
MSGGFPVGRPVNRSAKTHYRLSWLGILATALLALAPTVMRLHASIGSAHAGHAHHMHASNRGGDPSPDDCWRQCGYCDFLTHTPLVDSVQYLAPFVALAGHDLFLRETMLPNAHEAFASAAQPRGPPTFA